MLRLLKKTNGVELDDFPHFERQTINRLITKGKAKITRHTVKAGSLEYGYDAEFVVLAEKKQAI